MNETNPSFNARGYVLSGQPDPNDLLKSLKKLTTTTAKEVALTTTTTTAATTTTIVPPTSSSSTFLSTTAASTVADAVSDIASHSLSASIPATTALSSVARVLVRNTTRQTTAATEIFDATTGGELPADAHRLFPVFCGRNTPLRCFETPLGQCESCDAESAGGFVALVFLLGLMIFLGNLIVLEVVRRKRKRSKVDNMDLHRVSLALADLLTGLQLIVIPLYNYSWSMSSNSLEFTQRSADLYDSPEAKFGGVFFVLTFIASLFNLLYLAAQRLYAFVRPIQYKFQRKRVICLGLVAVWIVSIVASTIPVWIPREIVSSYSSGTFLFYPSRRTGATMTTSVLLFIIFYVLPYFVTVGMIAVSAFIVSKHVRRSSKQSANYSAPKSEASTSGETPFFITTAVMVIGFTLTTIPLFGVMIYQFATGNTYTDTAYVTCFYITMSNSLVNVIVYSVRDTGFRVIAKDIFCGTCRPCGRGEAMGGATKRKQLRSTSESYTNTGTSSANSKTPTRSVP